MEGPTNKTVKKLRLYRERQRSSIILKPQWQTRLGKWKDFKEHKKAISKSVPLAKSYGNEISHLTNSRVFRESRKLAKWLQEWKKSNDSDAIVVDYNIDKSDRDKKENKKDGKKKIFTICNKCGRRFRFSAIRSEAICAPCKLELDIIAYRQSQDEAEISP